ncbi:hypothetical protein T4B_13675 [Trichinella pseudospiralis]|uniref:Uncharacterized protein n=1 Tax=Trichinella pseudospiralis TaxID=6337 RepID=A0A0V1J0K6_TRIPS|nr:hypothetical protein T4B_13675 [Trichinella pseudospiralis]
MKRNDVSYQDLLDERHNHWISAAPTDQTDHWPEMMILKKHCRVCQERCQIRCMKCDLSSTVMICQHPSADVVNSYQIEVHK